MKKDTNYLINYELEKIEYNKNSLVKNAAIFGAGLVVVGLGTTGTLYFGNAIIEALQSKEALTYGLYTMNQLKGSGLGLSILGTVGGGVLSYKFGKETSSDIKSIKESKHEIKMLKLEQKRKEQQENDYR